MLNKFNQFFKMSHYRKIRACLVFTRVRTNFCTDKNLHGSSYDPAYKGLKRCLNGLIFYQYNPFTQNRVNSVRDYRTVCYSKTCNFPRFLVKERQTAICASFCPYKNLSGPVSTRSSIKVISLNN